MGVLAVLIGVSDLQEMEAVERRLRRTNWGFVVKHKAALLAACYCCVL